MASRLMGYDLHITRAVWPYESGRYPLAVSCSFDDDLLHEDGRLFAKNPDDALRRRMIELAATLDAWVIGEAGEVYEWDGSQVVSRWRSPEKYARRQRVITRGSATSGLNRHAPIRAEEWAALAGAQPDFETMTSVEVELPSGLGGSRARRLRAGRGIRLGG